MLVEQLRRNADERPDSPWIHFLDGSASLTFATGSDLAGTWSAALYEHGARAGDRVALMMGNRREYVGSFFGTVALGAVVVPINTALRGDSLTRILVDSKPIMVVTENAFAATAQDAIVSSGLPIALVVVDRQEQPDADQPGSARAIALDDVTEYGVREPASFDPWDPFAVMYTSGTTGPSKGSLWNHGTAATWAQTTVQYMAYGPDDVIYACLPLFHANALATGLLPTVVSGARIEIAERFRVSTFWDQVRNCGATSTNLLGVMAARLLKQSETQTRPEHGLRRVLISPCPEDIFVGLKTRFGVQPVEAYGLSDFGMLVWSSIDGSSPPGSCGLPVDDFEVRIVDQHDAEVPVGIVGECVARPRRPWITPEQYLGNPEATLASRRNLWFHTGDQMMRDENGYFYFLERTADVIRRRGENVSAHEVEMALLSHPLVTQAAAYAIASEEKSEHEIGVAVVVDPAIDEIGLLRHVWEQLPFFAVPRYIRKMDELPQSATQKVLKHILRAEGVTADTWDREQAGVDVRRDGIIVNAGRHPGVG
jgi:crotonobetaine/carnitine-CoA ligase